MILRDAQRRRLFSSSRAGDNREAGVWLIRRKGMNYSSVPDLEKQSKLELQTYVSGKLHDLRTLPDDWDDAGGGPSPQSVTHAAYRTLDRISDYRTVFPFVTPGEDGAILLEWRAGRERLEIEFCPQERPYVRYTDSRGKVRVRGHLGDSGIGYEIVRDALSAISTRVWSVNPQWKKLFS